ncbi:MAG: transcription termination/antitermination protein NusA [Candidatus Pacebacteria bacterium]|nr:transcription termination/antitermination protein NusA [Candidatus Paceibacterota bacterium]MBP9832387.1 transcription termination/antitermination protein NusA [Candidatus Paceibacterota bacterium]
MFDLKTINLVIEQLSEERGIPRDKMIEAIEGAVATAYKREYGKRDQIVRAHFDISTGGVDFYQVKMVVAPEEVRMDGDESPVEEGDDRPHYNEERFLFLEDAKRIKRDVAVGDELIFPLEKKTDFGRIAAQTAKQVIMQKIREAERASVVEEYGGKEGDIVHGIVQRIERGNLYVDLGRATGIMPYHEQIPGERYRAGERVRAYLFSVEEGVRGVFLRLSRAHPKFLEKLFELEVPEIASGAVVIKAIAREAGGRSKVAVHATDSRIDPVGALVGQRGVRVSTVMSELGGERIDIIEWSEEIKQFIEDALSPAQILSIELDEETHRAVAEVSEDQQSLAIGRGGQNVRLAAKLTGWSIDIRPVGGTAVAVSENEGGAVGLSAEELSSPEDKEVGEAETEAIEEAPIEQSVEKADA